MTDLELKARTIILRRMRPEDAETLFAYRSLPAVARYQNWLPASVDEAHELAKTQAGLEPGTPGTWFQFIICRREDGEIVGDCGILFAEDEHCSPELGIALHPDHRRLHSQPAQLGLHPPPRQARKRDDERDGQSCQQPRGQHHRASPAEPHSRSLPDPVGGGHRTL